MTPPPGMRQALVRGLLLRCPRCGRKDVMRHWFRIERRCPTCDYQLVRDENSFLGSITINYAVTGLAFIAYLVTMLVLTLPDTPLIPTMIGAGAICVVVPIICYPFSKTLWAALDLLSHSDQTS